MEVRLETTEGLGRTAEVWVGGHLLSVCDGVSTPQKRCMPGPLEGTRFTYVTEEGFAWEDAVAANPSRKQSLAPARSWGYIGYGRVMSVMPVVIDYGMLIMEDANWTSDESLVGKYVRVTIDRLDISWASTPDWPQDITSPRQR